MYRTRQDRKDYAAHLTRIRCADPYTYGLEAREKVAVNARALAEMEASTWIEGHGFVPFFGPWAVETAAATMPGVPMLTMAEAAQLLGLRTNTLRQAAKRRTLRVKRLGGTDRRAGLLVVDAAEVERYRVEHLGKLGRPPKA